MKFEIVNRVETEKDEKITQLSLEYIQDGSVTLVASDGVGTCVLLRIDLDGVFCRISDVHPGLGFPLNGDNEIIIE